MSQERHRRAKEIFLAARRQPVEARRAFIEEACGGDRELEQEVESLLGFLDAAGGALDPPSAAPGGEAVPRRIGDFRILRRLGEGGMGEVYLAEQERPIRRTVALKVIKWGLDSEQVLARFESERQALALMDHPAIARVYQAGATETGRPYFVMEHVPGLPITDYCDRHRLDVDERLALFVGLCRGVEHAHRRGVIHRDVKPSNVLVASRDGEHRPKLIDFGVAKAISHRLTERTLHTELGQWVGTPEIMSPEQAALGGADVDERTDVYSLGVLLYELLAGGRPFDGEALRRLGFDELRRTIREEEPPPPSRRFERLADAAAVAERRRSDAAAHRRRLRGDLDRIVMKALAKEPERRYRSPARLAADVERYLADEPVQARAPSAGYRLKKLLRRRRRAVATVALAAAAGLAGVAATLWVQPPPVAVDGGVAAAQDLYSQGRQRLRDRAPEALAQAVELFRRALAADPRHARSHAGLAEGLILLARRGDLPMAEAEGQAGAALKRALELDGELPEAHAALGLLHFTIGDLDAAESVLRRAVELDGTLAGAHLWLGRVHVERNRFEEADAAYRRALDLDPLNPVAHHAAARALMDRGRYDGAMRQFQSWLRIEPSSAETYRVMSLYARTYGRLDAAAGWARRAVELDPEGPLNLHELVMAYSGLGVYDQAALWMDRAYALAPNNHWTCSLKVFVDLDRGDFESAEAFTRELLEAEPLPAAEPLPQVARLRLALAGLVKVYRGDHALAAELYERALGVPFTGILEPGIDADALSFLAHAYSRLGRREEAESAAARCLELIHSRRDWIWARLIMPETLAAVQVIQGREDEAMATLSGAVADGWLNLSLLRRGPRFEELRRRQDFQRLTDRVEARIAELRQRVRATEAGTPGR